jgi:hypothetical protein
MLDDGTDATVFKQILDSPGLHLFVLKNDGILGAFAAPATAATAQPYAATDT